MKIQLTYMIFLLIITGISIADKLPTEVDDNQIFSIDTELETIGIVEENTDLDWIISSKYAIPTGALTKKQIVASVSYDNILLTTGGSLTETKNFEFDSQDQSKSNYNLNAEKILTYKGIDGSHLTGEEIALLDITGHYSSSSSTTIRCVFDDESSSSYKPAFTNMVKTQSSLINIEDAQISTKNQLRTIASSSSTPAGLNYQIAITPDSKNNYANGSVRTEFTGSILEARDTGKSTYNKVAADNDWSDKTEVTGGINNLQKTFEYQSGLKL